MGSDMLLILLRSGNDCSSWLLSVMCFLCVCVFVCVSGHKHESTCDCECLYEMCGPVQGQYGLG